MPYYSNEGLLLLKSCLGKTYSNCVKTRSIRFRTQYDVTKINLYPNTKDKATVLCNLFVVYNFSCPGSGVNCISKAEKTLYERTVENGWTDKNSAVYNHFNYGTGVQHLFDIASLHSSLFRHHHLFKT